MNRNLTIAATLAAALLAGCDPYGSENKSQPTVLRVLAVGGHDFVDPVIASPPTTAGGAFTLGAGNTTEGSGPLAEKNFIQIQASKLLDGRSINANPNECTPVPGSITVSAPAPAGSTWCVCYNPNSPNVDQGGNIDVFTCEDPTAIDPFSGVMPAAPFTITGTVKDQQGNSLPINVSVNPGTPPA